MSDLESALERLLKHGIKLNRNNRRELGDLVLEIASRDEISADEVMRLPQIKTVIEDPHMNGPQKLAGVKGVLRRIRYPALSLARDTFDRRIKEAALSARIDVSPPPNFEGSSVKVKFSYSSPDELRSIIKELERLAETDPVNDAIKVAEDIS